MEAVAESLTTTERIICHYGEVGHTDDPVADLAKRFNCDAGTVRRARARYLAELGQGERRTVALAELRMDRGTQMRPGLDEGRVDDLAELYRDGTPVDPIDVWHTPEGLVPSDGFHRIAAAASAGLEAIEATVRLGSLRDAILAAAQANIRGSLPRCRATRRAAVLALLKDEEWAQKPIVTIAQMVGVSRNLASAVLSEWANRNGHDMTTAVAVNGRTYNRKNRAEKPNQLSKDSQTAREDDPAPEPTPAPEPIDQEALKREWLESLPVRRKLSGAALKLFDHDALLYKSIVEHPTYSAFRNVAMPKCECNKIGAKRGAFQGRMSAFLRIEHPRDWLSCGECKGTGLIHGASECSSCHGRGYHVR